MKCSLEGLLTRAARDLDDAVNRLVPASELRGKAAALREVVQHIEDVRKGLATVEEFTQHYGIHPEKSNPMEVA